MLLMAHRKICSNSLPTYKEPVIPTYEFIDDFNIQSRSEENETLDWQGEVINNGEQENTKVFCTYCTHQFIPAEKSCMLCEALLCNMHIRLHSKSKEHVLAAPMEFFVRAKDQKCSIHNKDLEYYCFEDATCICISCCFAGTHKKHDIEPLRNASERKKKDFKNVLERLILQEVETDKRLQKLQSQRATVKEKASNLLVRVSTLFQDVRSQLDHLESRVHEDIAMEQDKVLQPISLLIENLEQQKDELSRKIRLTEELTNVSDPLTILRKGQTDFCYPKSRQSLLCDPDDLDEGLILVSLQRSLDELMGRMKRWHWASDVTLDVNTAANDVYLSGDRKTVSWSKINQRRQKTTERFKSYQVTSTQIFASGRHYWEIETCLSGNWIAGVCYLSLDRKGEVSVIGNNHKSWGLGCIDKKYKAMHNRTEAHLPSKLPCNKIGIYLDYEAGQLSFYEVSHVIRHIYTFTTTFMEPVHALFWVCQSWIRVDS